MVAIGTQLGRYEIVAPLGKGGMGEVFLAKDTRLGRDVAIKVLPEPFAKDPVRLARFEREARVVASLSHPNILAIHDYGTEQGISFAVMELLEGQTLRSRLSFSVLPWQQALEIAIAVADGLAAAHAKGIIHRDLKPDNLFLTSDGRVKILDFGLARVELPAPTQSDTSPYIPALTESGMLLGTLGYMAPEQIRGLTADARSDLFALGCVLHEMLAGKHPFQGQTWADTLATILHQDALALPDSSAPLEVEHVIRRCLAKKPEHRVQSASELASSLRAILQGVPEIPMVLPVEHAPTPERPARRVEQPTVTVQPAGAPTPSPARRKSTAISRPARKPGHGCLKLLLGCGVLATVMVGLIVGGVLWFVHRVAPEVKNWFEQELNRQSNWDDVARFWRPPPADAKPDQLFPKKVGEYVRDKNEAITEVPSLRMKAKGQLAVYKQANNRIELFVFRATKLEKEALLRRAWDVLSLEDEKQHPHGRSNRPDKPGYHKIQGSIEGSRLLYEYGPGLVPDQFGVFWWDKDWLFLCRSSVVKDPGSFLKEYLAALSKTLDSEDE